MEPKIKWNLAAFKQIRTMPQTQKLVDESANDVQTKAQSVSPGREYEVSSRVGTNLKCPGFCS